MMNPFYARYVPSSVGVESLKLDLNVDQNPSSKRRKTNQGFTPITAPSSEETRIVKSLNAHPKNGKDEDQERKKPSKNKKKGKFTDSADPTLLSKDHLPDISLRVQTAEEPLKADETSPPKKLLKVDETTAPKKRTRKKKGQAKQTALEKGSKTPFPTEDDHNSSMSDQDQNAKHKSIRARFEKSTKASAQIVESEAGIEDPGLERQEKRPAAPIKTHGLVPLPQPAQVPDTHVKPSFSALPEWLAHPAVVSHSERISLHNCIKPGILASLKQKGYQDAFAIQAAIIPLLLPGPRKYPGDICISAATGSGKTLAYALPMVQDLLEKPMTRLRGLVVVPTRELVSQVRECLDMCGSGSGLKIGTAVGSKSLKEEQELLIEMGHRYDPDTYQAKKERPFDEDEDLKDWDFETNSIEDGDEFECLTNYVADYNSKVDILICTPGRIVDHIKSTKGFTLNHVEWLVIDEADRLLDESFQQWIETVMPALEYQPPLDSLNEQLFNTFHLLRRRNVQKVILSATMTRDISKLMDLRLRRPKMIVLESTAKEQEDQDPPALNKLLLDSHNNIELPPTLKESAIPISDAEEKPLQLIELLQEEISLSIGLAKVLQKPKSSTSLECADESSSDSDESSDDSSSISSKLSSTSDTSSSRQLEVYPPKPSSRPSTYGTLIFTNNNENALRLARLLALLRPSWDSRISTLTKSTTSATGRKTLANFRAHRLSILIASDRASRGLDIPELAHVINYDMPTSVISYVHRVGRTARAGREGRATTLVMGHEARWFWNEIARAKGIVRAGKVKRLEESRLEKWQEQERKEYEASLRVLGEEARGERDRPKNQQSNKQITRQMDGELNVRLDEQKNSE